MKTKMELIADQAAQELRKLILEAEPRIKAAIDEQLEQRKDAGEEGQLVFKMGYGININLDANKADYKLAFTCRPVFESCKTIPDPNQPDLIEEEV